VGPPPTPLGWGDQNGGFSINVWLLHNLFLFTSVLNPISQRGCQFDENLTTNATLISIIGGGNERRGEERGGGVGDLFEWNISSIFKLPASPKLFGMACPLLFLLFLKWKIYSQEFYLEDWTWEDLLVWALCQLTWILPAPPPSPPPPPSPRLNFTIYIETGSLWARILVKIIGMTFPMQNCTRFFANSFLHFFLVLTNSFFHEKSLLSNFNPPLLHSYRQNPNIEPRTA